MIEIKSQRANTLLLKSVHECKQVLPSMRKYPGDEFNLSVGMELQDRNVKNLSYFGTIPSCDKVILESIACLVVQKNLTIFNTLSFRECEAYLRDRNSQPALEGISPDDELKFKKLFSWLSAWPVYESPKEYIFNPHRGGFKALKLTDKINEVRSFLNSPEVVSLFVNSIRPELVDIEDLTIYIKVLYQSEKEKSLFEELHILGVKAFHEENLNFIPDA